MILTVEYVRNFQIANNIAMQVSLRVYISSCRNIRKVELK